MRAVRYHEHGGPDVLQVDDVDAPTPAPDQVRVDVRAASVNPVDTYFREGSYEPPTLPMVPGDDVAGVVDAVGDDVDEFDVGDRVFGTGVSASGQGSFAEQATVPTDRVAHLPDGVSFAEGAAVALVGVTAWQALVDHGDVGPAQIALVHGGSGGVGHVAVQLASAAGAHVVTTASPEYHDRLTDLGADAVFDYHRDDLADAVTAEGAPEVILDHRLDDYLQFDADVAAQGARVAGIGNTDLAAGFTDVPAARAKELEIHLMSMYNNPDIAARLGRLARLMAAGEVVPDVARTYSFDEAGEAQRAVMEDSFFGKLVVEP
ncbi:NADPH:quinone reductase [Halobacteriaceae archaeon GCM10025711]